MATETRDHAVPRKQCKHKHLSPAYLESGVMLLPLSHYFVFLSTIALTLSAQRDQP